MAIGGYIGDENGVAQKVTKLYVGDENGIAQEVVKAYIGDENGIAQLCYIKAKAQVTLKGLNEQHYCVIGGTTYQGGDYALELEIGTPIVITSGSSLRVHVNNGVEDTALYCETFRYVVTGDVTITCYSEYIDFYTYKLAMIAEANPTSGGFVHRIKWITGEIDYDGFSCRGGMTWGQFVDSMYNDGHFNFNSRGEVSYDAGWVLYPDDLENNTGWAVYAENRIYGITYL